MWPDNSGYSGWFNPQYLMPYGAPAGQQQPMQSQGNWWDWWTTPQPQSPQQQQRNQMSQFGQQGMNMLKPAPQMAPQPFQLGGGPAPQTDPNLFATPGMPGPQPGQPQTMYGALAPGWPNIMDPRLRQQMLMRQLYGYGY
jgi:hypothetical protein